MIEHVVVQVVAPLDEYVPLTQLVGWDTPALETKLPGPAKLQAVLPRMLENEPLGQRLSKLTPASITAGVSRAMMGWYSPFVYVVPSTVGPDTVKVLVPSADKSVDPTHWVSCHHMYMPVLLQK